MSVEEEVELRDLVAQTLESNGSLAKIRAQLRASIFLTMDEDEMISSKQPLMNAKIKSQLETAEGKTMFCLVREFLQFFNLYFTLSVYDPESYFGNAYQFEGRQKLIDDLGLENIDDNFPILLHFVRNAQKNSERAHLNVSMNGSQSVRSVSTENESTNSKSDLSDDQASFDQNVPTKDNNNAILNDVIDPTMLVNGVEKIVNNNNEKFISQKDISLNNAFKECDISGSLITDNNSMLAIDSNDILMNGINEKCNDNSKPKSSPKSDKLKTKINLGDLSPIQMNKSRTGTDILPSLYTKEFKEKSNLRELDKLFDMEVEYEEDFMCSGDELSLKSDFSRAESVKVSLMDDVKSSNGSDRSISKPSKSLNSSNSGKPLFKTHIGNQKTTKDTSSLEKRCDSESISSISEMLDVTASH